MNRFRFALPLACCLTLASCSFFIGEDEPDVFPRTSDVYAGWFAQGIEDSVFKPCDLDEQWLLVGADSVFSAFYQRMAAAQVENPAYVRLRGTPSERGQYRGFFITYDRRFTLEATEEVRALREGECGR